MNGFLNENLPVSLEVGVDKYEISSDFRTMLRIEEVFSSPKTAAEKGEQALRLFYGCIPSDVESAATQMEWFLLGGKTPKKKQQKEQEENEPEEYYCSPICSFHHDAGLIYAAFLTQYGIDLYDVAYLHWWKFLALFEGLENDRVIKEVMHCRAVKVQPDTPKSQREYYNEMKKRYAIPLPEHIEEQNDALIAALMGDGDVSKILVGRG